MIDRRTMQPLWPAFGQQARLSWPKLTWVSTPRETEVRWVEPPAIRLTPCAVQDARAEDPERLSMPIWLCALLARKRVPPPAIRLQTTAWWELSRRTVWSAVQE